VEHLFLSYSPELGGAERLLLDVAAGLDEPPALACPPGRLMAAAREAGLAVQPLRPRRLELRASLADRAAAPLRIAGQARELRALLGRARPRVLVGWNMRGLLVASAALRGLRRPPALVFQHNDFLPGPAIAAAVRAAARGAARVSCCSRAVAAELDPRGALAGRLRVIAPGVDAGGFGPVAPPPADRAEVLLLGAIVGWKRPQLALEAVALAAPRLPALQLTLAGGPLGDEGERLLGQLRRRACAEDLRGRVSFAGALADPRPALARASCLLHCAEREPFGLALVEALAAGRPVLAPAAGGALDIVDEGCGRLYEPGDAVAAAAALVELLGAPGLAARLGGAGRERAERVFSLERARGEYRELLASVR